MASDESLVKSALEGDEIAFGALIKRYEKQVLGMSYAITRNYQDAEDAAQTSFVKAFKSLSTLRETDKFANWLSKITYATCKDFLRKQKRESLSLEKLQSGGAIGRPVSDCIKMEQELDTVLTSVITELPESVQIVVTMRFYDNLSYDEIAEFLNVPHSTVRGMLYRGTQFLRKRIGPYLPRQARPEEK